MPETEYERNARAASRDPEAGHALYELYQLNSSLVRCDVGTFQRIAYFNQVGSEFLRKAGKKYVCADTFPLPPPVEEPGVTLVEAIQRRTSVRRFAGGEIDLPRLSVLLKYANGLLDSRLENDLPRRAIPSGGALYPTDLYVLPLEDSALPLGAYHYDPINHGLDRFTSEPAEPVLAQATETGISLITASMVLAIASCPARQRVKYGERAYRFTLLECGHLAQNIVLLTSALGLGALPVGGFLDNEVNDYLGLDGAGEAAQYLILLGQLPKP